MRRFALLLFAVLCLALPARAETLSFLEGPEVLRPGKIYDFVVDAPIEGTMTMELTDLSGHTVYDIYIDYPISAGRTVVYWNGLRTDGSVIEAGEYLLHMQVEHLQVERPLRLGAAYPLLTSLRQSDDRLDKQPVAIGFDASVAGQVEVLLRSEADGTTVPLATLHVEVGANVYQWDGNVGGARVPDGWYGLLLTLYADNGTESMQHRMPIGVGMGAAAPQAAQAAMEAPAQGSETVAVDPAQALEGIAIINVDGEEDATEAPAVGGISPPYSAIADGTYWAMTPGETDDAAVWAVLMQPITVYDGGLDQKEHVYLMENPDGAGRKVAQAHAQSQGLHVIGEVNEHGYVLVETFSSYDDVYYPMTEEEKANVTALKQGYVKAANLKEVKVQQDIALVIDKLSQRMHIYIDGERVDSLLVSTGLITDGKYYRETPPGEFITVSRVGPFSTHKYMKSEMAIRISGGILIHEVPYEPLADGSKRYSNFEALLGSKASAGCIRVQRKESAEGYNQQWVWDNLKNGAYKVIIWDDEGRLDIPQ